MPRAPPPHVPDSFHSVPAGAQHSSRAHQPNAQRGTTTNLKEKTDDRTAPRYAIRQRGRLAPRQQENDMLQDSKSQPVTHTPHSATFSPPPVLTPEAFHQRIGGVIGKNRIYELLHAGRIRHVRIGNRFLILGQEVSDFFEREAALVAHEVR